MSILQHSINDLIDSNDDVENIFFNETQNANSISIANPFLIGE